MLFCRYRIRVGLFLLPELGFNQNVKVEQLCWEDSLSCAFFFLLYLIFWVTGCTYSLLKRQGENLHKDICTVSSVKKCLEGLDTPMMCKLLYDCTERCSSCFILFLRLDFLFVLCWHPFPIVGREMTNNQTNLLISSSHGFIVFTVLLLPSCIN